MGSQYVSKSSFRNTIIFISVILFTKFSVAVLHAGFIGTVNPGDISPDEHKFYWISIIQIFSLLQVVIAPFLLRFGFDAMDVRDRAGFSHVIKRITGDEKADVKVGSYLGRSELAKPFFLWIFVIVELISGVGYLIGVIMRTVYYLSIAITSIYMKRVALSMLVLDAYCTLVTIVVLVLIFTVLFSFLPSSKKEAENVSLEDIVSGASDPDGAKLYLENAGTA